MKNEKFEIIAKTLQGLEDILAQEIAELGGEDIEIGKRMVSFKGDKQLLYKTNLCCRTALRVLKPIFSFTASDTDEVYEKIKSFDWHQYLSPEQTFSIESVVFSEEFKHSKFVTYRAKDAIADFFMEKTGKRPSVRLNNADLILNLHITPALYLSTVPANRYTKEDTESHKPKLPLMKFWQPALFLNRDGKVKKIS